METIIYIATGIFVLYTILRTTTDLINKKVNFIFSTCLIIAAIILQSFVYEPSIKEFSFLISPFVFLYLYLATSSLALTKFILSADDPCYRPLMYDTKRWTALTFSNLLGMILNYACVMLVFLFVSWYVALVFLALSFAVPIIMGFIFRGFGGLINIFICNFFINVLLYIFLIFTFIIANI